MKRVLIQLFSTFIISIGYVLNGYSVAWPSDALEILEGKASPLGYSITKSEASLVGSLPMLGSFLACVGTGWISDSIGRKKAQILCALCYVAAWSTKTTASNVPLLLIGRFIVGVANGMLLVFGTPYISELSEPKLQGTNICLSILLYLVGNLAAYVTGWLLSYQVNMYICLTTSVVYVVLLCLWKDTPPFLLKIGKDKEALKSLKFYRGSTMNTPKILDELEYLKSQIERRNEKTDTKEEILLQDENTINGEAKDAKTELSVWKTLWTSTPSRRAIIMISLYTILFVFGGTIAVMVYAGPLFLKATPGLSSHVCSILLSIAFLVGCLMTTVVSSVIGRRTLMLSSAVLSSWFLVIVASLLRWSWGPEWLIPASLLGYCTMFQMGVGNVPFIQLSECFGPKLKSLTSVIIFSLMNLCNFVVLALFSPMVDALGLDGTFFVFSSICLATAIISYFTMKETKGRTLEEIQVMFAKSYWKCS